MIKMVLLRVCVVELISKRAAAAARVFHLPYPYSVENRLNTFVSKRAQIQHMNSNFIQQFLQYQHARRTHP